jgi:hypothetical protein
MAEASSGRCAGSGDGVMKAKTSHFGRVMAVLY